MKYTESFCVHNRNKRNYNENYVRKLIKNRNKGRRD